MSRSTSLAHQFIQAELPTEEIATLVFRSVDKLGNITMPTPLPAALVLSSTKKDGWEAAVTHAASTRDPELLDRLARDSRKQVRRAVAHNPALSSATAGYLYEWATAKAMDNETLPPLMKHLDLDWLLTPERVAAATKIRFSGWEPVATRIIESGDAVLIRRAAHLGCQSLSHHLAGVIVNHPTPHLSITELVTAWFHSQDRRTVLYGAWTMNQGAITLELAELALRELTSSHIPRTTKAVYFTEEAIEVVLASDNIAMKRLLAKTTSDHQVLDRLIEMNIPQVFEELIPDHIERLTSAQIDRVLAIMAEQKIDYRGNSAIEKLRVSDTGEARYEVSSYAVIELLRHSGIDATFAWLEGRRSHQPAPGDVSALLSRAGRAFNSSYGSGAHYALSEKPTPTQMARALGTRIEHLLDKPWSDELVDGLGTGIFDGSGYPERTKYLIARLSEGIGTSPRAWEICWGLLDNFEGSLGDLITMTKRLLKASGELPVPAGN